jgi:hypothetical protein
MKVGDLVTWANTFYQSDAYAHPTRIGIIIEIDVPSWDALHEVVKVRWSDGHCFDYLTSDLEVINEKA